MMDTKEYILYDTLESSIFFRSNPLINGLAGIDPILEILHTHANEFLPDQASLGNVNRGYSVSEVKQLLASMQSNSMITLVLTRSVEPKITYSFSFIGGVSPIGLWLRIVLPMSYFDYVETSKQRADAFVNLVTTLCKLYPPLYGYAHSKVDLSLGTDPHQSDPVAAFNVYEIYWLNIYGKLMVEQLGRGRVLSTPSVRIEELPDGGVSFLTWPTPAEFSSPSARIAQAQALAHLRDDISFDTALDLLRRRSEILSPVERDWDVDIQDLLELTLTDVLYGDRQAETIKLNKYRPPAVSEWRPLADLLEPNVPEVGATIERYAGLYAEQLVALLHKDIPEVMQASPESLPLIDYHFWHFDYPEEFTRENIEKNLVPAIGAYLGEVLVRNLGGKWVPRRNLEEAQVVLGNRAWLPFLRARRYMQSRQSILDYSITKFYRTAERHLKEA